MHYVIVDIETTGKSALKGGKITEIALFISDGTKIIDQYSTLINPETSIPYNITRLTGISNELVADAPKFYEVAKKINEFTEGKIFVAHNVAFDYGFLLQEFKALGGTFTRKKLCTVKLSRQYIPGLPSYSLGKLCAAVGISLKNHHRAEADAKATTELLHLILNHKIHQNTLFSTSSLLEQLTNHLPNTPGVYFLKDKEKQIIYIGKSIHIKKRVQSHLGNFLTKKGQRIIEQVQSIDYTETGSEMLALFYESYLIKKHLPKYNARERKTKSTIGAYLEEKNGYSTIVLKPLKENKTTPLRSFDRMGEGKLWQITFIEQNNLCMHLNAGKEIGGRGCFRSMIKKCIYCQKATLKEDYNSKVKSLFQINKPIEPNYYMYDLGRNALEKSYLLVERNIVKQGGFYKEDEKKQHPLFLNNSMNRDYERILASTHKKIRKNIGNAWIEYTE